jgi:hypothetical protein
LTSAVAPTSNCGYLMGLQVKHSEEEWLELLGQQSYNILRLEGTERPWSSPLNGRVQWQSVALVNSHSPHSSPHLRCLLLQRRHASVGHPSANKAFIRGNVWLGNYFTHELTARLVIPGSQMRRGTAPLSAGAARPHCTMPVPSTTLGQVQPATLCTCTHVPTCCYGCGWADVPKLLLRSRNAFCTCCCVSSSGWPSFYQAIPGETQILL